MPIMCRDPGSRHHGQIEQCTDPDRLASLARYLGKCKSTPDLSFTAVSLLTKTLTARATRLETSASKFRLAADKEAFRTTTVNKRRRESGPKNASEFMRQTIRNRHDKAAHHQNKNMNHGERSQQAATRTNRTELPFAADVAAACPSNRAVFQPRRQEGPWGSTPIDSLLPQRRGDARACSTKGSTPPGTVGTSRTQQRRARSAGTRRRDAATTWPDGTCEPEEEEERSSPPDRAPRFRRHNSWNLEDDADIRLHLDVDDQPGASSNYTRTSTTKAAGPSSSGANHNSGNNRGSSRRCSELKLKTKPASCGRHDRPRTATGAARGNNPSSANSTSGGKGCNNTPRPRTAARSSRRSEAGTYSSSLSTGKGLDRSDKGQQQHQHQHQKPWPRGGEKLGRGIIVEEADTPSVGKGLDRSGRGQQKQQQQQQQQPWSRGGGRLGGRGGGIVDGGGGEEVQPFEVTAMGRKVHPSLGRTKDKAERWLPAKTLNGLDRLQRSRMLASKRPEVTGASAWAGQREGRQQGSAPQRGHVPYGMCTRWLK